MTKVPHKFKHSLCQLVPVNLFFAIDKPKRLVRVEIICNTYLVVAWERWQISVLFLKLVHCGVVSVLVTTYIVGLWAVTRWSWKV